MSSLPTTTLETGWQHARVTPLRNDWLNKQHDATMMDCTLGLKWVFFENNLMVSKQLNNIVRDEHQLVFLWWCNRMEGVTSQWDIYSTTKSKKSFFNLSKEKKCKKPLFKHMRTLKKQSAFINLNGASLVVQHGCQPKSFQTGVVTQQELKLAQLLPKPVTSSSKALHWTT